MAMKVHHYEKAFLWFGALMLVVFLVALLFASVAMGIHLPGRVEQGVVDPADVRTIPPFDAPGVHRTGENAFQAVIISQAWAFQPREIRVPAGAEITFLSTSVDVIHGLHIEGSRINMMLIPGQVARNSYTFDEPGRHLMVCHEFCGAGHHLMAGEVVVVDPAEFEAEPTARAGPAEINPSAPAAVDGIAVTDTAGGDR